jgi:magnesium transporter
MGYEDAMLTESHMPMRGDTIIDIDDNENVDMASSSHSGEAGPGNMRRRMTFAAEEDVCFPQDILSEVAEEDEYRQEPGLETPRIRRRRRKQWPDLAILNEWRAEENEAIAINEIRARKVHEPLLVGGRLRPQKQAWHREVDDAPYRFTYFNEEFESTIHGQTISELLQPGQTFRDLFIPEPPVLSDDSSDDEDDLQHSSQTADLDRKGTGLANPPSSGIFKTESGRLSLNKQLSNGNSTVHSSTMDPTSTPSSQTAQKPKRYGPRPVFWLDVLSPTDAEMRTLSKAFGIHPLTAEDIMVQEAREKVELFRNYYFVNYRSFEQDATNEEYLEPVNMYVVVFREGVLSVSIQEFCAP